MSYKYFSIMRPVGIGTFPGRPEKIVNYSEGKKDVITADGQTIRAWGEVIYTDPLTETEIRNYELRGDRQFQPYRHIGYWMGNQTMEIIKLGNKFYTLGEWNGTAFASCFEVLSPTKMAESDVEYTLKPIYFHETDAGISMMDEMTDLDEDSPEWKEKAEKLNTIVSYSVSRN